MHDPSVPAWINAVTVVVLAGITWWYASNAKRQADAAESQAAAATKQADAAESQARAALKQAEAAERQLTILQAQIEERVGIASEKLKANIKELQQAANSWSQRMVSWGQLTAQSGTDILPKEWSIVIEHARNMSPDLYRELLALGASCRDVCRLIDEFSSTRENNRNGAVANAISGKLAAISDGCRSTLSKL